MSSRTLYPGCLLALLALPSWASAEDKDKLAAETAVYNALMASAPAIDRCVEAYVTEVPDAAGAAKIDVTVGKSGEVSKAVVGSSLPNRRTLVSCLEGAAKTWKFPPLKESEESASLSITVQVKKGAKFVLRKPGDKSPPAPGQPEGYINFLPSAWGEGSK